MSGNRPPETCPLCGTDLAPNARACPECGADHRTGWSDAAEADRLGLPDDPAAFDHTAWEQAEFGTTTPRRAHGRVRPQPRHAPRPIWRWVAAALLAALALAWFGWSR